MILAIDPGLKNLSFCIMSSEDPHSFLKYKIHLWDTYNTIQEEPDKICCGIKKNNLQCSKKASVIDSEAFYCKTHLPSGVIITKKNTVKKIKVKDYCLQDLTRKIISKITEIYNTNIELFSQIKKIRIELQPRINPTMKLISHIIYGKFVEICDSSIDIKFVSASKKLKAYNGPAITCNLKGAYAKRKWLSIEYFKWMLENIFSKDECLRWMPTLLNGRADNTDTALMCINLLTPNTYKKNKKIKKCILD